MQNEILMCDGSGNGQYFRGNVWRCYPDGREADELTIPEAEEGDLFFFGPDAEEYEVIEWPTGELVGVIVENYTELESE